MKKNWIICLCLFFFFSANAQERDLLAHFPLQSDGNEASGKIEPLTLINISLKGGGAYCQGVYGDYDNSEGNLITTQNINHWNLQNFGVMLSFKVKTYSTMPVFMIGYAYRLIGVYLMDNGTLELRANNMDIVLPAISEVTYATNRWQDLTIDYRDNRIMMFLNDQPILDEVLELKPDGLEDQNMSTANFSNGESFKGHWKNLQIYGEASEEKNQEEQIEDSGNNEIIADNNNNNNGNNVSNNPNLQIFTSKTCGRCRMSKQFLASNNIAYTDLDVDNNEANKNKMWNLLLAKGVNNVTFPVVINNGELFYNIADLNGFLNNLKNKKGGVQNVNSNNNGENTNNNSDANTNTTAKEYVERHNYWRSQLGIAPVKWSDELAKFAQAWANELGRQNCKMEHRPSNGQWKQMYGENIFWASGFVPSPKDVVDSWAAERKDYNHNTQECKGGWYPCGHYTQVIWEKSTQIGCASFKCKDGSVVVVCNYNPPGNYSGEKAYKKK